MKKTFTLISLSLSLSLSPVKADSWTQKANFPGAGKVYPFSFSIFNKGYIGCGTDASGTGTSAFWEYDPSANTWTQKANFGGGTRWGGCSGFSIANKGYAGLGFASGGIPIGDFWEYDPAANSWSQKANFGGGVRIGAISFSAGAMGYIGTGLLGTSSNDLWQYDPAANSWIQKQNFSLGTTDANVFVVGNSAYLLGGCTGGYFNFNWQYNTITDTWTQKADLPADERCDAAAFSICDKGYWGIGELTGLNYESDLWQYNPLTNSWIQKTGFPGAARDEPAYFSIGSKGYLGLGGEDGWNTGIVFNDFWEYTPDSACSTGIEELPSSPGELQFTISPNPSKEFIIISYPLNGKENLKITITDARGKKVFETPSSIINHPDKYGTSQSKISLNGFSKGIYSVEINNGKEKAKKKFIKI